MTATSACDRDTRADEDSAILQKYVQDKFAIAHQVRLFEHLLRTRESTARAEQCRALSTKLAEDRFTLAVVGQFKRGKSSLMNAIIGREILPTGVLPLTSAVTICNGLQSKRAGTAISAFLGPHYLPLSPYSRPQYLPLRLQSSVSDCNQRSQDHIICH
jgi:hypothetical protein